MPRSPVNRPIPKAEALAALKAARKMLDYPLTPFMLEQVGRYIEHAEVQIGLVQEVTRPRKARAAGDGVVRGGAVSGGTVKAVTS